MNNSKLSAAIERGKNVLPVIALWVKVHSLNYPYYYLDKKTDIPVFFIIKKGDGGSLEWSVKPKE